MTPQEFVTWLLPSARRQIDLTPEFIIAQAALESGWLGGLVFSSSSNPLLSCEWYREIIESLTSLGIESPVSTSFFILRSVSFISFGNLNSVVSIIPFSSLKKCALQKE